MSRIKVCKVCGVPLLVSNGQTWDNNGVIYETKDPEHRMIFYESDNLDRLFTGIEEIIGLPIGRIVVECKSRLTKEYLEKMIPAVVRKAIYLARPATIAKRMANIAKAYGYGDVRVEEIYRRFGSEDYMVITVRNPYSFLFFQGDNLGGMEAATGRECTVESEKVSEDTYKIVVRIGVHPPELRERLHVKRYLLKPGSISMERCPACGIPKEVASFRWNLQDGIITDPETGRRMALYGNVGLEAVFKELESELGETIPDAVIEAQRRFVRETMSRKDWQEITPEGFKRMMAIRGLGMLTQMEIDEQHATVTIENSCIHLLMVGTLQGLYELITRKEDTVREWELKDNGDLTVSVRSG